MLNQPIKFLTLIRFHYFHKCLAKISKTAEASSRTFKFESLINNIVSPEKKEV